MNEEDTGDYSLVFDHCVHTPIVKKIGWFASRFALLGMVCAAVTMCAADAAEAGDAVKGKAIFADPPRQYSTGL